MYEMNLEITYLRSLPDLPVTNELKQYLYRYSLYQDSVNRSIDIIIHFWACIQQDLDLVSNMFSIVS